MAVTYKLIGESLSGKKFVICESDSIEKLDDITKEKYKDFFDLVQKEGFDIIGASIVYTYHKKDFKIDVMYRSDRFDAKKMKNDLFRHYILNKVELNAFLYNTFLKPLEKNQSDRYYKGEEMKSVAPFLLFCKRMYTSKETDVNDLNALFDYYFDSYKKHRDSYFKLKKWNSNYRNIIEDEIKETNLRLVGKTIPVWSAMNVNLEDRSHYYTAQVMTEADVANNLLDTYGMDELLSMYTNEELMRMGINVTDGTKRGR